jgi:hypothetical protein
MVLGREHVDLFLIYTQPILEAKLAPTDIEMLAERWVGVETIRRPRTPVRPKSRHFVGEQP